MNVLDSDGLGRLVVPGPGGADQNDFAAFAGSALVLSVDNVKTSLSRRESLNGVAEPGRDLLETDIFEVTETVRAKNRCNSSRLETAGPAFTNSLELFGPRRH